MRFNRYYKSLVFITISLSFYLSAQDVHAADKDADSADECGGALTSVPLILKPVGAFHNTEMKETSAIDIHGVKKGVFSFPIDNKRKKQIEIEYIFGDIDNIYFLSGFDFEFLKKVFDTIPAILLSKVDKVTILFRKIVFQPPSIIEALSDFPNREGGSQEEVQHRFLANEMDIIIPYFPQNDYKSFNFNDFYGSLIHHMQHAIEHVMAYRRYGQLTWREAVIRDSQNLSSDMDVTEDGEDALSDIEMTLKLAFSINFTLFALQSKLFK